MTQEIEQKAREIGWKPAEEFRGDSANWVDAEEYIRRGETLIPLIKAENRQLVDKAGKLGGEIARLAAVVEEQRKSMDQMLEYNAQQLKDRLTEQKRQLSTQLREARRGEDDRLVEELEVRLEENGEARASLAAVPVVKKEDPVVQQPVAETPEYRAWLEENKDWYNGSSRADIAKTAAAQQFGIEAAKMGKRGQAFFDHVNEAMAEAYPKQTRRDPSEEGRPSGGGGSGKSADSSFNALPAEAKAKAKEQVSRFVGANKMFKDEKAWFAYYAKQYNTEAA